MADDDDDPDGIPEEEEEVVVKARFPVPPEIGDKMKAAYPLFLRRGANKTQIPETAVGAIIRCGCINPTESQIQGIYSACKKANTIATTPGFFEYDNFEQQVAALIFQEKGIFKRLPKEKILEALKTIFPGRDTAPGNEFREVFLRRGERFSLEEGSKLFRAAADFDTRLVYFEEYAELLANDGIPPPPE